MNLTRALQFYSFKNIDITTEQWDQFQKEYAGKVTDINIDVVLNPACLSDLNNLVKAHGGSLCPRLRKLHIGRNDRQEEGHWTSIVELLAQPTLKEVEVVQGCLKNASMNDVIYTLVAKAPHIDTVEIFTPAFCPDYGAFSEAKRLSVDGFFDHATWRACAALPKLERLEIWDASYYEPLDAERRQTYAVTFVSLTKLGIHDEDEQRHPNFIASIFRNTTMPLLQTLELGCSRDVNMGMVRRCLAKRSPLLREIELNGKEEKGPIEIVDGGGGDGEDEEENEGSADVDDEYGSDHYQ
ncbi:hypothetical protein FRB94_013727 [Tulasnella sp. JGI-2019a]|nr:hypothetical protein FRB94_013727 [Tulasnella sp. JGI-2019a]KAG9009170.1 hypothetical protein FRB93_005666 [Tulasnella sp. JGI-2019a]KAG9038199.1 hypothetical protein FRB95_002639 [Tulasnella sp. JGI-2019a]